MKKFHSQHSIKKLQSGFALLPVAIALIVVAAVVLLISYQGATSVNRVTSDFEANQAHYVTEAGMQHALWQARNSNCAGDFTIPSTSIGSDSYTASSTGGGTSTAYTLSVDQDAWIRSDDTDKNNGAAADLHIRYESGNIEQPLIRFDLSALPANAQINSASVWFYIEIGKEHPEGHITLHSIITDWIESDVTWDSFNSSYDSTPIGMISVQDTSGVWVQVNLTAQVQAWVNGQPNYGILLNTVEEGVHAEYTSSEGGAGQQPRLEVVVGNGEASPLNIQATGTLAAGITRTLSRPVTVAYQTPVIHTYRPDATESDDAEIWDQSPDNNYGDAAETWVSSASNDTTRTLLRFNLDEIPRGSKILEATLTLERQSGSGAGQPITAHRITNSWSESSVTWNKRHTFSNWGTAGGDFDNLAIATTPVGPGNQDYKWNITPMVQSWVDGTYSNYGVILVAGISGMVGHRFYTSDQSVHDRRPSLNVTYACECNSTCLAPKGNGDVAMVVNFQGFSPGPEDQAKEQLFESWGYQVTPHDDNFLWLLNPSFYDVIYVSETASSTAVGTQLTNYSIGVVNEQGNLNDELGMASDKATTIGFTINVVDNNHYITNPFPTGTLDIYSKDMEGITVSGTEAPGLQTLADTSSAGSLVVLDEGMPTTTGGTAAGKRVMLPLGRATNSNFNWNYLNNDGRLLVQRSLQWASGNIAEVIPKIILATEGSATLGGLNFTDKDLAEYDSEADTASMYLDGSTVGLNQDIDAVHVLANNHLLLSTIGTTTLGGLTFENEDVIDYDPSTDEATMLLDGSALFTSGSTDISAVHFLDNGNLLLTNEYNATLGGLSFEPNDIIEYNISSDTTTLYLDGDAVGLNGLIDAVHLLSNGRIVLSTINNETLGGLSFEDGDLVEYDPISDTATLYFDEDLFSGNEDIRAVHIGPGIGGDTNNLLFVVIDPSSLTTQESAKKALIESWGYTVNLIDVDDPQSAFDTAVSNNDVVFISEDISSGDLNTKLVNVTIGVVSEEGNLSDEFGISDGIAWDSNDEITIQDNTHYITQPFAIGDLTVLTTIESLYYLTPNLAPDLSSIGRIPQGISLVTLDAGAITSSGGSAAGRRAMLPWGGDNMDVNNLNTDGLTIFQRALEWASGEGEGSGTTLPIAHWMLDDGTGTTAIDSVGGHDGTLINGPTWDVGQLDGALNFDGSNDYINVPHSESLSLSGDMTFSTWANVDNTSNGYQAILTKDDPGNGRSNYWFGIDNDELVFGYWASGSFRFVKSSSANLNSGEWYHLAASFNNMDNTVRLYIDGSEIHVDSISQEPTIETASLWLGRSVDGEYWNGILDDVRIYDHLLSSSDIADLASAGVGGGSGCDGTYRDEFNTDVSFAGNDGTLAWPGNWGEVGESDGAGEGDIQVTEDDQHESSQFQLRTRDNNNGGEGVEREADLSGVTNATLNYLYRRQSLDNSNDYTSVEVSANGASGPWTELTRHQGSGTDSSYQSASHDISSYVSTNTRIRFKTSSSMGNNDIVWFDDIEIAVSGCAN